MTELIEHICHPEQLTQEDLSGLELLIEKYPYFQPPRLLYLYLLYQLESADYEEALRKSSIFITDRRSLYSLINNVLPTGTAPETSRNSEKTSRKFEERNGRSFSLIDDFLSEYSDEAGEKEAQALIEHPSKKDVPADYTSYLVGKEAKLEEVSQEDNVAEAPVVVPISSRPIPKKKQEEVEISQPVVEAESISDKYFTETLAKIYVKQGKYSKALEIIQRLYLRNPNKNAYFADQIRYLEKLLINSRNQKNKIK